MSNINKQEVIRCTVVLFCICFVVTALLAGTYVLTKDPIAAAAAEASAQARSQVLPADRYVLVDGYDDVYIAYANDGTLLGCIVTTTSKGYGGDIKIMTGILSTGNVCGVQILEISETAGVGMKVNDSAYLNQYVTFTLEEISASDLPPSAAVSEVKEYSLGDSELGAEYVDAISGATISSNAVTAAINDALDIYNELAEKGILVKTEPVTVSASADAAASSQGGEQ